MKKKTTGGLVASRECWDTLETTLRLRIQSFLQDLLDAEVTEFLGRQKSARRGEADRVGYRNGYGKKRRLTLSCGTVELERPRVRETEERFESAVLPLFQRRTKAVTEVLPRLYLHGLAQGDFELALRGLWGDGAPLSGSTVARLTAKWTTEYEAWCARSLEDLEPVYMWADGVYVKAGLEKEKAALLVVIVGLANGRKEIVALVPGFRESKETWAAVLRDLRDRGLRAPRLVIADGHLGIWAGLREVYPEADEQRCWNHRIMNILAKVPKTLQREAKERLRAIPQAATREQAVQRKKLFKAWCREHHLRDAEAAIEKDWDRLVAFYGYPQAHWKHLRTSNVVESPFCSMRIRTDAARRFKRVENATALIYKILTTGQRKFRRLDAPELLPALLAGARYTDGLPIAGRTDAA